MTYRADGNDNIWRCADAAWTYGIVLCRFWTNRSYVDFNACLNLTMSLLGIRYTMQNDRINIARSPAIQLHLQYRLSRRWCGCWCWLNAWNGIGIMSALNKRYHVHEQAVRLYLCMFKFGFIITWYTLRHEWHNRNHPSACYLTTIPMTYIRLCADVYFDCIWNGIMALSLLHARLLCNCNGNDKRLRGNVDVQSIWNGHAFALNEQTVRWC